MAFLVVDRYSINEGYTDKTNQGIHTFTSKEDLDEWIIREAKECYDHNTRADFIDGLEVFHTSNVEPEKVEVETTYVIKVK